MKCYLLMEFFYNNTALRFNMFSQIALLTLGIFILSNQIWITCALYASLLNRCGAIAASQEGGFP